MLAGELDSIIHSGASVNLVRSYESLKPVNVLGTQVAQRIYSFIYLFANAFIYSFVHLSLHCLIDGLFFSLADRWINCSLD